MKSIGIIGTALVASFWAFITSLFIAFAYMHDNNPVVVYAFMYGVTLAVAVAAGYLMYRRKR